MCWASDVYICIDEHNLFVAFVEDNATMSSIRYFENHVSYFCATSKEVVPITLISLLQMSACISIELKYI